MTNDFTMENYYLSKEQAIALQVIEKNKLSLLPYLDKINLVSTLSHALIQDARKGKRSLLIIENKEIQDLVNKRLAEMQVSSLVLSMEENDFLTESSISKIRTLHKRKEGNQELDSVKVVHQLQANHQKINNAFTTLTNKIFGERKWIDLHTLKPRTKKVFTAESIKIPLELTQQEFWHLRGKIEEAKSLYHFKTQVNDNILQKFNIRLESEDKIPELKEHLIRFKIRLEDIQSKFDSEINRYKDKIWRKIEEEYIVVNSVIEDIEFNSKLLKFAQSPRKRSILFGRKPNDKEKYFIQIFEKSKALDDNILIDLPDGYKIEAEEDIEDLLRIIKTQLNDWKEKGNSVIVRMLRSLNKNNSDSENLLNIDQEINVLYQEINDSRLFREYFENTSMNTMHQYQAIDTMLSQVKVLLSYIASNKDIVLWQSFMNQLNSTGRQVIQLLKKYDLSDWIPLFEKWYLDKLIVKHGHPDIHIIPDALYLQKELRQKWKNYCAGAIESMLSDKRKKATSQCQNRNRKLYQRLFKKKGAEDIRAFELIWNEKELLTYYFPIMLVSAKIFRSNRLMKDGKWDQIYCEDTQIFQHVEKYNFLEQKICFFAPLAESFKVGNHLGIKIDDPQKSAKLLIHEYNYSLPIKELPISDKLKAAKKLAKVLLSLNQDIRVFQLKNANILSLADNIKNRTLINTYDNDGIKEIIPEDSLYETVTECILETDREQYLIHQDYLVNINHHQCYLWQIKALEDFEQAGFKLINVSNLKLKEDKTHFIDQVTKQIAKQVREIKPIAAKA